MEWETNYLWLTVEFDIFSNSEEAEKEALKKAKPPLRSYALERKVRVAATNLERGFAFQPHLQVRRWLPYQMLELHSQQYFPE